ncbi:MAG: hypothetical protein L3J07_02850 [Candidatus Magasanikbacteria bacterium]|nr:hypothetical protein [Candidatus Magasanikbacteria bacterium]
MATAVTAGQLKKSGSLTRSIFDSGEFLPIVAVALRSMGAGGAIADVLSNMKGFSMKDLLGTTKTIAKQYTPAMAQKKIMNAGNKIKDTGKKISDSGAFKAIKQKAGFGDHRPKQTTDPDFATDEQLSPEFGGGDEKEEEQEESSFTEEPDENEEDEEDTPGEKPYQPFSKPKPEEEKEELDKKKKEKQEKEKTPKESDQERSKKFQQSKNQQRLRSKKGNGKEDVKKRKGGKEKKEKKEKEGKKEFTNIELIVWLPCAIAADIASIIPYVGLVISWPFGISFFIFKWVKKFNKSTTVMVSGLDVILEGFFSTIPANTADVLITYSISKAKKYGVKIPDAEKKLKKVTGAKPK